MIDIDLTMVIQIINIVVLIAIMNMVLYKPVRSILEAREKKITDLGNEIDNFTRNAKLRLEEFDQKISSARQKAKEQFDAARSAALGAGAESLSKVREEADKAKTEQFKQIEGQFAAAQKELQGQVEGFANEMAGKVLGRAL